MTLTAATSPPDYAAFLRDQYALQTPNVASYRLGSEQVWLKKAGPRHSMARYRVLGLLAWLTRLQVLRPVPNLGGSTAIATEARRLHSLAALGLRVPEVLAQQPEGLLLRRPLKLANVVDVLNRAATPTVAMSAVASQGDDFYFRSVEEYVGKDDASTRPGTPVVDPWRDRRPGARRPR